MKWVNDISTEWKNQLNCVSLLGVETNIYLNGRILEKRLWRELGITNNFILFLALVNTQLSYL